MKLQNKKTGEIRNLSVDMDRPDDGIRVYADDGVSYRMYNSLAELNENWEDYEEPKGIQEVMTQDEDIIIRMGSIEEAEKAVEKLKAWTRLRNKGVRSKGWFWDKNYGTCIILGDSEENDYVDDVDDTRKDLDLLFGGEE